MEKSWLLPKLKYFAINSQCGNLTLFVWTETKIANVVSVFLSARYVSCYVVLRLHLSIYIRMVFIIYSSVFALH